MRRKIKYINSSGAEIEFTHKRPYILSSFETSLGVNISSSKGANMDGEFYLGNTLDKTSVTLKITLVGRSHIEYLELKDKVNRCFNPKTNEGYLIYEDGIKKLKLLCIAEKIPHIVDETQVSGVGNIHLMACDAYWKDTEEIFEAIALWKPLFEFPDGYIEFTDDGMEFESRELSLIKNIVNDGHVETGMTITFSSNGRVENPALYNLMNGQYFRAIKTMNTGEKLIVTSQFGNKKILSEKGENLIDCFDQDSSFLKLEVGENIFRYDADSNINSLDVSISYEKQYLGV